MADYPPEIANALFFLFIFLVLSSMSGTALEESAFVQGAGAIILIPFQILSDAFAHGGGLLSLVVFAVLGYALFLVFPHVLGTNFCNLALISALILVLTGMWRF